MEVISMDELMSIDPEYVKGCSYLGNFDVIIVEGFEMVGKSTLISKFLSNLEKRQPSTKVSTYRPDYGVLDSHLDRSDRHIPGLVALDVFKVTKSPGDILVLDRSFLSSLAYGSIYDGKSESDLELIQSSYLETLDGLNVLVVVVGVDSREELEVRYELSLMSRSEVDDYDLFDSFEDYYSSYLEFTDAFTSIATELSHESSGHRNIKSVYLNNTSDDLSKDLENLLESSYDSEINWTKVVSKLSEIAEEVRTWSGKTIPLGVDKSADYSKLIRILKSVRDLS